MRLPVAIVVGVVFVTGLGTLASTPALAGPAHRASATGKVHRIEKVCAPTAQHLSCGALRQADPDQPPVSPQAAGTWVAQASLPSGYGPSDLRSAYNLSASGSPAQTVAIVDAFDDPAAESDLATYRSTYGLPACTTANGCFRKVNQSGAASPLPSPDVNWAGEISLDLAMVSAICPGCHILLLEGDASTVESLGTAVNTAVAMGAKFVSNSYGTPEPANAASYDSSYYYHPGVVITASSGDTGYGTQYPASGQGVTAVGGTSLTKAPGTARGWTETAWSGAGSGCSAAFPRPATQTNLNTGCGNRAVTDVSAVADPQTGVAVYQSYTSSTMKPGWQVYGGTSVAAPVIAAVYALAGDPGPSDVPNSYPYAGPAGSLNDVTSGSNGTCAGTMCTAGPGWDGPTGLGTPDGLAAFTAPPAAAPVATTPAVGFVPAGPARVLDTRTGVGAGGTVARLGPDSSLVLTMPNPPAGVSAVVFNLTATNMDGAPATYVAACPAAQPLPECSATSAINPNAGVNIANQVTVPIAADGKVRLYNNSGRLDLVADLAGYHTTGFTPAGPTRVLDTRTGVGAGGTVARVGPGEVLTVAMPAPPPGVSAVVFNLTATNMDGAPATYVAACPAAQPLPECSATSAINPNAGVNIANQVTVPIASDGLVRLYNSQGSLDLIADLAGYHTAGFTPAGPNRVLDTRTGTGTGGKVARVGPGEVLTVAMPAPPPGVSAVVFNLTATNMDGAPATYVAACPAAQALPECSATSAINPNAGVNIANQLTVPIASDGLVRLYNSQGSLDLIADLAGYLTGS